MANRAGKITLKTDGMVLDAKGSFTYNIGEEKRTAIVGADRVHGYYTQPQVPFIEGIITDDAALDLGALLRGKDLTATLDLANGKTIVLRQAWYAGEGNVTTEQGEISARWEGLSATEIAA
ncbi:phage tail protein [Roseomonas terrae]|uniref:Phage tail protein n=1 Tax=Neoroseomonas terrae TaxID=424799 RepID=A0ABS5EH79_9PROT|nr:phage tail tube protein [Neoroseomonas terrae]MBR0650377.1 phage tail protein [Neoroseomonas terrae]